MQAGNNSKSGSKPVGNLHLRNTHSEERNNSGAANMSKDNNTTT